MQKVLLAWTHAIRIVTEKKAMRLWSLFFVVLATSVVAVSIYAGGARAAANDTINFQARVLNSGGSVVADGFYTVEFNLYNVSSGGTTQWTETQVITTKNGYITASLGAVTPFGTGIDWSQEQWLTMNINGDGEMNPRMQITAVPLAFRANQADTLTTTSGTISASDLAQLAPGLVQSVNSANTALRVNQTGAGSLLQLQGDGSDVLTLTKAGSLTLAQGITVGASTSTTAGTIRWSGVDFEGYDGTQWVSLTAGTGGGGSGNTSITFTSSVTNMAATATTSAGLLTFTSGTAVSNTAGTTTGFVAPADGSFRSCVVNNNAAITAGTLSIRWRVNGVSTGAAACTMNNTTPRYGATTIDAGIVTFNAGDTINIAFESAGLTPAGSTEYTAYWTVEYGGNGTPSDAFVQGGNAYAANAVLGTTDNFSLNFITNGLSRLTVSNTGSVNVVNDLTVGTGLTITNGGLDVTGDGISNAGSITGLGSSLSATAGLTISTGASDSLTLDAGNDILVLSDATLQRTASGATTLELNDTSNTIFAITNTDGSAVAGLSVEGGVTALTFSGDGQNITNLDASNIASGSISDARLSSNVGLLNTAQTFSALQTFNDGLTLGSTTNTTAGTLRWTGVDFEGYNGSAWVSLTSGGGGGGGGGAAGSVVSVIKSADETVNNSAALQNDNHLTFAVDANDEWTFRFVVQAQSGVTPGLQFAVTAPSGATCDISFIDAEGAVTSSNVACGVSSGLLAGNGVTDVYEITGSVRNGATAGNVTLQWAQQTADASNTTVYAGSYLNAIPVSGGAPSNAFIQGGNTYGATAVLGTTDANALTLITGGISRINVSAAGSVTVTDTLTVNGDITIGDAATDVLTLQADSVQLPNGLDIDSGTLTVDSTLNTIGINTTAGANTLAINTAATADANAEVLIYTNGINQKGLVLQTASGQVANAFEVQKDDGVAILSVDGTGILTLGSDSVGSSNAGYLALNDSVNANGFTSVLGTSTLTGNRTISLPDASGTICISGSATCGFIILGSSTAQTDSSTNSSIFINKTGASGDILTLQKNGTTILRMLNSGALQLSLTDAAAFTVENASGTDVFNVDTSTGLVRIGAATADGTGVLFVLDTKNTAGDPTGTNGGQYYNSNNNKFRCFENNVWRDCIYEPAVRSFIDTTADAAIDANTTNYWDLAAENNNATPNYTPSATSKAIMGVVSVETTATGNTDAEFTARVERGIGAAPTCGSGTVVGARVGTFSTNTGVIKSSTMQFVDTPNTTSQVFYVVCSDAATNGTAVNVTHIRVTLQEVNNSN